MTPKSNTLFHFTKNVETLKLILKGGFWPRYCLEDVAWLGYEQFSYIGYPMVCFCEIPLTRISEHVDFYGSFGIGLTREWAEKNGLNPVFYVSGGNNVSGAYRELNTLSNLGGDAEITAKIKVVLRDFLAFTKPTFGTMIIEDKPIEKAFYQESEWRYIAKHDDVKQYIIQSVYDDVEKRSDHNESTRANCLLRVAPSDIRYIFVRRDSDIPEIINFIQAELDAYPSADLKVLMSRVVSLESISLDM
ncbi:abortive infection system antitoxin AbiGi family protein [Pseudomonas tolaasii]|uniref:abortive infection system antitoxin AbiGi family protein n=1 Tax=Pseudomonas tolaasii TaxID=29442 RepID=UPI001C5DF6A5|nr:abortive infection system antitoxin AbiGi family protein [Pseudomonas tolaasii]MBW4793803.1 hypothetical protein [Pseudomonas tolaasii]